MSKTKRKMTLDKVTRAKPAFVMAEPNDDAAAFGWSLGKLRYPSQDSKPGDVWPGPCMFEVPVPYEVKQVYGHIIEFVNPAFVQLMLDSDPDVRKGAEKVRRAKYAPAAMAKFQKTILAVFTTKIVPEIVKRFTAVAGNVAEFYTARLAHIDTFGLEE
jgi:hypothetical protein